MLKFNRLEIKDIPKIDNEYSDYKETYSYLSELSKLYSACKELLTVVRSRKPLVNFKVTTKQ